MSCLHSRNGSIVVCAPRIVESKKWRRICPSCTFRATTVGFFAEWYGWHVICLHCGEEWQDGEWGERPFAPGWRQRNIEAAKKRWQQQGTLPLGQEGA